MVLIKNLKFPVIVFLADSYEAYGNSEWFSYDYSYYQFHLLETVVDSNGIEYSQAEWVDAKGSFSWFWRIFLKQNDGEFSFRNKRPIEVDEFLVKIGSFEGALENYGESFDSIKEIIELVYNSNGEDLGLGDYESKLFGHRFKNWYKKNIC